MAWLPFPIVMYHRIEDPLYRKTSGLALSGESCSVEKFRADLARLKERCRVLSLDVIATALAADFRPPPGIAAITFDDGTRDHVDIVLPILLEFGLPATFFVMSGPLDGWIPPTFKMQLITGGAIPLDEVAGLIFPRVLGAVAPEFADHWRAGIEVPPERYIGEPTQDVHRMKYLVNCLMPARVKDAVVEALFREMFGDEAAEDKICSRMFLDAADINRLHAQGMTIGCHSRSHYNLATIEDPIEVFREVAGSAGEIADATTGIRPKLFAYPAGGRAGYTHANVELVRKHYTAACITGTQKDLVTESDDRYELPRIHERYFGEVV